MITYMYFCSGTFVDGDAISFSMPVDDVES